MPEATNSLTERQIAAHLRRAHEARPDDSFASKVPGGVSYWRARHVAIKCGLAAALRINRPQRRIARRSEG